MASSELEIIQRYFSTKISRPSINRLGIGDDAALLEIPSGQQLVTSIDSLNEGIHFPSQVTAFDLGHKALAVSLSDMAAMGAEPVAALLSLSLPMADLDWLSNFSAGLLQLAQQFNVDLIGGDMCRGPLSITTVVNGLVPRGKALLRSGANVGDRIYVTGTLGDAGLALKLLTTGAVVIDPLLLARLHRPEPRVAAGLALRSVASSAMDLSDGLLTDLNKLCLMSKVGAILYAEQLPLSNALLDHCNSIEAWQYALCSGDDYELVFTLPVANENDLNHLSLEIPVTCVGEIIMGSSVTLLDASRQPVIMSRKGYDHFGEAV